MATGYSVSVDESCDQNTPGIKCFTSRLNFTVSVSSSLPSYSVQCDYLDISSVYNTVGKETISRVTGTF